MRIGHSSLSIQSEVHLEIRNAFLRKLETWLQEKLPQEQKRSVLPMAQLDGTVRCDVELASLVPVYPPKITAVVGRGQKRSGAPVL